MPPRSRWATVWRIYIASYGVLFRTTRTALESESEKFQINLRLLAAFATFSRGDLHKMKSRKAVRLKISFRSFYGPLILFTGDQEPCEKNLFFHVCWLLSMHKTLDLLLLQRVNIWTFPTGGENTLAHGREDSDCLRTEESTKNPRRYGSLRVMPLHIRASRWRTIWNIAILSFGAKWRRTDIEILSLTPELSTTIV